MRVRLQQPARPLALALVALAVAGAIGTAVLGGTTLATSLAATTVVFVVVGAYVGYRVPRNPVGWLLALFGLTLGSYAFLESYALAGMPFGDWALWFASMLWLPALVILVVFVPLLFPDGQPPGPRWHWVLWVAPIGVVLVWAGNAFTEDLLDDYGLSNPVQAQVPASLLEVGLLIGTLLVFTSLVAGIVAAVVRYRRSQGILRQQMKWFAASALLLIPALVLMGWAYESGPRSLAPLFFVVGSLGMPLAIAAAILRYRLFEIDRIVSRTVSYAIVVTLLVGAVALVAAAIGTQFDNPLVVAATTLGVAASFNPLRRRVQTWVDRRFNRSRYDAERVMDEFTGSLRDRVATEDVLSGWTGVVERTMQPRSVGVWVRE